jgi:hypothetical protein
MMGDDWKRPTRGFDEISSVFLSSAEFDRSAGTVPGPDPSQSSSPLQFAVLCCLSPSPAVESFFACNLAVEIAKNNQNVTLIDYGFERSIVRRLMGCKNPAADVFHPGNTVHPDYKVESVSFHGLPEITLVSPAMPRDRNFPGRTVERIFAEERVRNCNVILINSPVGSDEVAVPEIFTGIRKAILFMDAQQHSLAKAYSLVKRLSSGCSHYLIGAVPSPGEESSPVEQNVSKLQKAIFKHLRVGLALRVVTVPLDREARISMQTGEPLALMDSSIHSSSADAIMKLCENLLRNE